MINNVLSSDDRTILPRRHRDGYRRARLLSPEEDAISSGDEEIDDEIDPTLPADLWFRSP
jgi:hypothetical protein